MQPAIESALLAMAELEGGAISNPDENRMVGHYWPRDSELAPNVEISTAIQETLAKVKEIARQVHAGELQSANGSFTHLLVIGIGGSALGLQFVGKAYHPHTDRLQVHFFDNTDPDGIDLALAEIGDALSTTLVLVISNPRNAPRPETGCSKRLMPFPKKAWTYPNRPSR